MLGEFTMLQLYHVALTAGKAHKDHKHHHVHHFAHDGSPLQLTTPQPPTPPVAIQQGNSVLVGGQITPMLELNLGNAPQVVPAQLPNGLQLNQQFVNGQFTPGRTISEQLFNSRQAPQQFFGSPPRLVLGSPLKRLTFNTSRGPSRGTICSRGATRRGTREIIPRKRSKGKVRT
jgi:hypothetical protein